MIQKELSKFLFDKKTVLLENFLSLFSLQFLGYLIPLVTFPYLVRILGIENYGIYVFFQYLFLFLDNIIAYGFRVSATDQISKNINNYNKISLIFHSVLIVKFLIFFILLILLIIASYFFYLYF